MPIEWSGFEPWQGVALRSSARHLTLTVPLLTEVYKWVLANLMAGITLRWASFPSSRHEQIVLVSLGKVASQCTQMLL